MTPELKSQLRMLMGVHGIVNVVECMTQVAEEFGEGRLANPDSWWLEVAAHLSTLHDELLRLTMEEN